MSSACMENIGDVRAKNKLLVQEGDDNYELTKKNLSREEDLIPNKDNSLQIIEEEKQRLLAEHAAILQEHHPKAKS